MTTTVNTKNAPASKAVNKTVPVKKSTTVANSKNTGIAGPAEPDSNNVADNIGSPQSGDSLATELSTHIPDSQDDAEAAFLEEDIATEITAVRQSGKTTKSGKKSGLTVKAAPVDPYFGFTLVIPQGKAVKLNPKTNNHVFFEVAIKADDKTLHIRMSGNEGGGLHSKEWLALTLICELIEKHQGQSFKSTIFNPLFKGSSANNAGFLGAVLRCEKIGLLNASNVALYQHQVPADYVARKAVLMALLDE